MFRSTLTSTARIGARNFSSSFSAQSFARAQLLGRVGQDIVASESPNGTKYVRYPLAVSYKKDAPVNWFNVITFNEQQIDFLTNYVHKGALVHVEANIQQDVYEREDGSKSINYSYIQQRIDLLQNPRTEEAAAEQESK